MHDIDDHPLPHCPETNPIYEGTVWPEELIRGSESLLCKLLDRLGDDIDVYARGKNLALRA
ncbi:hypothetical protein JIM95_010730 [Corynebacterium sp. CCM 8835]|uniref:Uncharacterized protein n=1 Tax=Corynebacterium antarcticum TaxID=2800405 RepID=A0ABS1FJ72_9CORY|nr:hypothetical protein [Corynebacterium antarcticum]MCK7643232.1 hypothetical protein [Corynebacterium antarcticum]MCK7661735.1 hypothetical protein [Corynebacterium antarcticum]MCL0246606.1 hypothetical protein [Corynebacterium antarcticum]MCX7492747.1 hypothetical protein [Corynebacterium antarcticum]MCX7541076.1 hypothetical protein [Corynebacterium antarcticum]